MRFGSLFSGIGGFDLGLERAGMTCAWQVEIDPACYRVLARHWPGVERYEDVKEVGKHQLAPADLVCGGFPCQDVSVAGKREGLAGERSGLFFEAARIIAELRPKWIVIENVPGLLSSNGGRDMGAVLGTLADIGYMGGYRVLDSQNFGVPQRRRRVFIVGYLGDGRGLDVLFESESGAWDAPPRKKAGQGYSPVSGTLAANAGGVNRPAGNANELDFVVPALRGNGVGTQKIGDSRGQDFVIAFDKSRGTVSGDVSGPLRVNGGASPGVNDGKADNQCVVVFGGGQQPGDRDVSTSLSSKNQRNDWETETFIAWHENQGGNLAVDANGIAKALKAGASHSYQGVGVRRLTPTECERLQGFPDGWTAGYSDTTRYRMLGNAITVNVAEWIGNRIMDV